MENITTKTCETCAGNLQIVIAGIRVDCPECDGFGVIVQSYTDSDCLPVYDFDVTEFNQLTIKILD